MKRALVALLLAAACSERARPARDRDPERQRRVIEPPSRGVRALPPHAIRADGVGPFKLGATAGELLEQLPSGPRITQFMIPGVVRQDIMRAEDDAIVIGTEPQGKATFISVVRGEIARTETGVHVGSTRDELVTALGPLRDELDRVRDPRVVAPTSLRNARVVLAGDRIAALVITNEPPKDVAPTEPTCTRPAAEPAEQMFGACLATGGELFRYAADELALIGHADEAGARGSARGSDEPSRDRAIATMRVPGLVFAGALRNPIDGRDEIVAITKTGDAQVQSWTLIRYRQAEGKLVRADEPVVVYQLSSANARWIGAELRDLDLLLEVSSRGEAIEVGGLLTSRIGNKLRDIIVISPVPVARRRAKAVVHDAGTADTMPGAAE